MGLQREAHLAFEKYFEALISFSLASALVTRRGKTHLRRLKPSGRANLRSRSNVYVLDRKSVV